MTMPKNKQYPGEAKAAFVARKGKKGKMRALANAKAAATATKVAGKSPFAKAGGF
jgi:hypothetical protein